MGIPIIFVHKGASEYLNYTLNQVHFFNPQTPIYLITDVKKKSFNFVTYIDISKHSKDADAFAKLYKHMSTNNEAIELFCFQRWFMIRDFAAMKGINDLLYLDSDVLLYCNVDQQFSKYKSYDHTICNKIGPQYTYFSGFDKLDKFCNFISALYTTENYFAKLKEKHQHHLKNNLPGGVCDMTAFGEYQFYQMGNVKDLSVIEEGSTFDDNMNCSDGYEMSELGIKRIVLKEKKAQGYFTDGKTAVLFNALHFQGPAKRHIYRFYVGTGLVGQRLKDRLRVIKSNLTKRK